MDEPIIKRKMPESLEAEQAVIGSMLLDEAAVEQASELLIRDDFYHQQYGIIFEAIMELHNERQPIDPITLQDRLRKKDAPENICTAEFLTDLANAVPVSSRVKSYAKVVKDKAILRNIIRVNQSIENMCYEGTQEIDDILERTEKEVFALAQGRGGSDYTPIRQVVMNALRKIEAAGKVKGNVTGVATGFIDLDLKTAGMQNSDLILLAARPSMGKTAFALNIAQYAAFRSDLCVAIFSLEMSKEQLVNRMFSLESRVDAQTLRTGNLDDSQWEDLLEGAGVVAGSKLIIDDTPSISVAEMKTKCRKYKMEMGLNMIIIDYLQLMSGSGGRSSDSRQQEISELSRALKGLARELNVPVIALSQLSRAVEQRPDHRPMLSDLRESGAIEQDADVVMFIYRDDYYNKDTEKKGISEIIIAKQRNGPIGTTELAWLPQYTKFANLER